MESVELILTSATVLTFLMTGITQMVKPFIKNTNLIAPINCLIGLVVGLLFSLSFYPNEVFIYLWGGFCSGLMASGLFEGIKGLSKLKGGN